MHTDRVTDVDVRHVLRRDQDILLAVRRVGGVDLLSITHENTFEHKRESGERTIIFILIRRFTASMNTSNSSEERMVRTTGVEDMWRTHQDNGSDSRWTPTATGAGRSSRTTSRHHSGSEDPSPGCSAASSSDHRFGPIDI